MRVCLAVVAALVAAAALVGQALGAERFKRLTAPDTGMSLAVPASWRAIDASLPASALREFERRNLKLAPYIRLLTAPNSPTKLLAFDPVGRDGFATNVNVVAVPVPRLSLAQYRAALAREIRSLTGSPPKTAIVTLDGQRAVRLDYRLALTVGTTTTVQTLQYAFQRPGRSVVVTYSTLPSQQKRYAPTFTRSAASIRFS